MSEKLPTNSQISHYRVVSKIGAGGMGEVYLAQDTKLDRKVALKILPADFSADETRMSRFIREAKSVSALNHPNILTIHEIGEDSSQHYIATEFIAGKTLRELLQDGPLPILQSLETACQIGAALNAAHQAGIIHRDIKPENVMVRADGLVKVLDFGLAKLTGGASDPDSETRIQSETQPGMIIGTVAYMSPQQARGKAVDARTDVWSLGVVIYEMLTGLQPFRGETMTDTLANILHACPEPLNIEPPDLAQIVSKMLGKKLEARYATINDVVVELKYLQRRIEFETELDRKSPLNKRTEEQTVMKPSTFSGPAIDSASARADEGFWVAVLPFKVSDEDPAVAVLADGLSEEIVTGLSRFRYLSVVTSASAVRLKGEIEDVRSVGAKLGTRYVLQGSIRKGGSVIRVSAQLVDTETGAQLWSETYNRDLETSTIFSVQDDVAGRIVATVADNYGVLVHSMRAAMLKKDDADLTPVEWQFQYFAYREQITPAAHASLKSRLQRVAERNVGQSDLWACLAQIYVDEYAFGFQDDATSLDRALAAGRRAVELDRANQFALVALAQVHFFRRDLAAFGPAAERGMSLNPLNTDALGILGLQIVHTGQFERGTTIVRRAMELNPNHAGWMHFAPLWNHFHKGEYEQALECANRVDVPGLFWPYLVMASACGHLGRRVEAEAAVKDLLALDPEFAAHVRSNVESWHFASGLLEPLLEGLRKAGLEISDKEPASASVTPVVSSEIRTDEGFWVAVLPFKFTGSNTEVASLAEGLSEEIVTGLSRFSYLRVISRSSTRRYTSETSDFRTIGKVLGARYVMEGSLRLAGSLLRVSVQLVDSSTGAHLWAETYDRPFKSDDIFALQDDLVPRIVATIADQYGPLVHSMSESLRGKSVGDYSAHEAVLRSFGYRERILSSFGYRERISEEEHAEVRKILEVAVAVEPNHSDCQAALAGMYWHEHANGFNLRPDPLGRALEAAQRAVAASPTNHLAHSSLAAVLFFKKDFLAFRPVAERVLALNQMDASTSAFVGFMIAYSGDWEYGLQVTERARQMNPRHPGWYYLPVYYDAYRRRDYRGALEIALKVNMSGYVYIHAVRAAALGQLGEQEPARAALRELHKLKPDFGAQASELFSKFFDPELTAHLLDGLRKAGLAIGHETGTSAISFARNVSSESRADEGFWVAVVPFKFTGSSPEVHALAEGLSEDIVTGLSRFSYLRVIARSSTERFTSEATDVRLVGQELGARYVLEGSLRQAGAKLRLAVQLVDATTGAHLWAENYERVFDRESIFELQDDLVPRIVSTIADSHGVLPRSMSKLVLGRAPEQLSPYETVLRSFNYFQLVTPEELTAARSCLEMTVAKAPAYADAWAMLALLCVQDYGQGFNLQADSLANGLSAARRAVETGPSSHLAYFSLAQALFFRKELQSFRNAAERAVSLNPMDGNSIAFVGELLTYAGDAERGLALAARAKQLNPNHPGWYWYVDCYNAYNQGDYPGALGFALKVNLPGHWGEHLFLAAVYGQLGDTEAAGKALRELLRMRPSFATTARSATEKWFPPEYCERLIDGLQKAGLEVADISSGSRFATTSSPSLVNRPGIVVLPFVNRSPDRDNEYFSDGLTEEIISDLSGIKKLRVISRNSSMTFKGTTRDTLSIAKELGVSHVVSGSVRRAGDDLRVTVELIEVASDTSLWSHKYSGTMANVFGIQEEIAQQIVAALQVRLTDTEKQQANLRPIQDTVAYDCYLRARQEMYRWTPESMDRADQLVDQALGIVGDNALLLATKGQIHWNKVNVLIDPDERHLDLAADCARRALAIDENEYLAIFVRGIVAGLRGDTASALRDIYRAHQLRPGDPNVLTELCRFANSSGIDVDDYVKELVSMDPLTPVTWCVVAFNHMENGRIADSVPAARRIVELSPGPSPAHLFASSALAMAGLSDEPIKLAATCGRHLPGTLHGSWANFLRYAFAADRERACEAMTPLLEKGAALVDLVSYNLAAGYSLIGKNDESLKWLRTAMDRGFINYPFLAKYDQLLNNVRSDPRFPELMKEVKKRWETLARNLPGNLKAQRFIESHWVDEVSKATAVNRTPASAVPNFDNRTAIVDISASPRHLVTQSPSIAVLPFVNISNDTDNEYFCDGLAEELLNALSKIETLRVAARTSAFSFKGREIDIREIGKKLNVGAVLEGSVRKAGNRVRIAAQLVNIADGYQLWSEKYDRQLEDIFDIQDEISLSIVAALKVKLLGAEKAKVTKRYTGNTEAYQLYLKGRFFVNQRTSGSLRKAIQYFNEAISVDPNYALGYAGLTDAYLVFGVPDAVTEALAPQDALPKARAAGEKALELDKSVAEIYPSLAHAKWKARDWVGAENNYKRGIELNPNYPIAHFYYAVYLASLGRHDEAVKEITRAQELDPLSLPVNASVSYVLYFCRRYDEAIAAGKKTLELDPAFPLTHQRLGLPYIQKQMYLEAIAEFQQAVNNSNRAPQPLISLGHAYALAGNKVEAENVLSELREKSQGRYVSPYGVATIYLGLGDIEQAFHWLDKAYDEQNTELTFLRVDPRLDPLRDDVRFQELLNKVGFPFEPKSAQSSSS